MPRFGYNKNKSVNTSVIFISGTSFLSDSKIKSLADVIIKFWDCFSFGPYVVLKKEHMWFIWKRIEIGDKSSLICSGERTGFLSWVQFSIQILCVATMQARWMFCEYFILKGKKDWYAMIPTTKKILSPSCFR